MFWVIAVDHKFGNISNKSGMGLNHSDIGHFCLFFNNHLRDSGYLEAVDEDCIHMQLYKKSSSPFCLLHLGFKFNIKTFQTQLHDT